MQGKQKLSKCALRRDTILKTLEQNEFVNVTDLGNKLNTSAVTIRKDLEYLESQGLLIRTHGGAKKCTNIDSNLRIQHKQTEKSQIARAASALVNKGDFLFINTGSTCFYVIEELKKKTDFTVVTNSYTILSSLVTTPSITTFFLGGQVNTDMKITVGDDVLEQLDKYTADKLFLGMDGIDIEMGATTYNHVEDAIMRKMMMRSKEKILVVDDSKFDKVTFAKIADLKDFDTIITNYSERTVDLIEQIRDMGLRVICAPAAN